MWLANLSLPGTGYFNLGHLVSLFHFLESGPDDSLNHMKLLIIDHFDLQPGAMFPPDIVCTTLSRSEESAY